MEEHAGADVNGQIEESLNQLQPRPQAALEHGHSVGQAPQPLVSPPANTNAGADTILTFTQPVRAVMIQNLTAVTVNFNFDAAASAGTFQLAANGQPQLYLVPCSTLHLFTAAAQPINAAAGIIVRGW